MTDEEKKQKLKKLLETLEKHAKALDFLKSFLAETRQKKAEKNEIEKKGIKLFRKRTKSPA